MTSLSIIVAHILLARYPNQITIDHSCVDEVHFELLKNGNWIYLNDQSKFGTYVNKRKMIFFQSLKDGDQISFVGNFIFVDPAPPILTLHYCDDEASPNDHGYGYTRPSKKIENKILKVRRARGGWGRYRIRVVLAVKCRII